MTWGASETGGWVRDVFWPVLDIRDRVTTLDSDPNAILTSWTQAGGVQTIALGTAGNHSSAATGVARLWPLRGRQGRIITGFPYVMPQFWLELVTAPTASKDMWVIVGVVDGSDITTNQFSGGGWYFDDAGADLRLCNDGGITDATNNTNRTYIHLSYLDSILETTASAVGVNRIRGCMSASRLGGNGVGNVRGIFDEHTGVPYIFVAAGVQNAPGGDDLTCSFRVGYRLPDRFTSYTAGGGG